MALESNSQSPDLRIYTPVFGPDCPLREEVLQSRSDLLHKIHTFYLEAQELLDFSGWIRPLGFYAPRSPFCLGLLDPVSNLVIDNLISCKPKRKREHESSDGCEEDPGRRSLDGMVAFLTRLFPDLAESQAVRYLHLADADALVAARILVSELGMKSFYESGPAVMEMALLKCALLAAGHPDPYSVVCAWHNISSRIDEVLRLLNRLRRSRSGRTPSLPITKLRKIVNEGQRPYCDEGVGWAWRLAASRSRPSILPYITTRLLTRPLHDAIHGFYLLALARLPAGELRSRFHRSLLKAGHCYGPLDPVSNIIINTVWYDAAFPPTKKLKLKVIGTGSLQRIENRSLYGLASFLCTRYHPLEFHEAVRCLLQADANLVLSDPNLDPATATATATATAYASFCPPHTSVKDAFFAAATAACHPYPEAQAKLLTSCKAMLGSALSLLQGSEKLSSQDVQRLATLLSPESPSCDTRALLPLPLTGYPHEEIAAAHIRLSKKVNAMLKAYEPMPNGDPRFALHVICGVNDQVPGPNSYFPNEYGHSHVNFMATPKSPRGGGVPILFFAEISNAYGETSFCCPVALPKPCTAQIRCLHCEFMGTRIVHPVGIDFHGGESEFEKMACGKSLYYSNMDIINNRRRLADAIHSSVEEDSLYDDLDGHKIEEYDLGSMSIKARVMWLTRVL